MYCSYVYLPHQAAREGEVEKSQLAMALIRPCGIRVGELECFEETRSRWCVRLICFSL